MEKRIKIVDIARMSGTSPAAVSKILGTSNSKSIGVCKEKAELIRKIANEHNYVPNMHARALHGKSIKLLGILVDSHQAPVMSRLLASLEHYATQSGYHTIIGEAHNNIEGLHNVYARLKQQGVDGIICMSHDYASQEKKFAELFESEKNIVFQNVPSLKGSHACVRLDLETGVKESVLFLKKQKRKRIGMICVAPKINTTIERIRGYNAVIPEQDRKIFFLEKSDTVSEIKSNILESVKSFVIPEKLDALIMYSDLFAIAMLEALRQNGLSVPKDIALIGCDNEPFCEFCNPSLTTLDQNTESAAEAMIDLLLKKIENRDNADSPKIVSVPPKLIRREST